MTLISSNTKTNILTKLNDIVNIEDPEWSNLEIDLKLKIVHNLCNFFKNNINSNSTKQMIQSTSIKLNSFDIPLKNQRPKKIIEFGGINKQSNTELFDEFKKNIIIVNREFRKTFNSKNKNYCFANLSNDKYKSIINNYNLGIYNFINKNIDKIDSNKLFNNLIEGNQQKIICSNNKSNLKINKITYIDEFLNIEFNNDISIKLELYLTSEKITSNIPAKYKIFLTNIY